LRPFGLTLIGILILVAMGIVAAIAIGSGEAQQRFLILIGIIGTAVTALLAVYRAESNAQRLETRTDELGAELRAAATTDLEEIKGKIDENTAISAAAFEAANNFADRLAAQERFLTDKFNRLLDEGGNDAQDSS
jgi:hypothetical protein